MYVEGNTYRFRFTATLNGAVWDLTGATVRFRLRSPSGVVLTKIATIEDSANGIAYYDSQTTDLTVPGNWVRSWEITQGTVVQESDPVRFYVRPDLG